MEHTKACLAKSMLAAVENFRDSESITLTEFIVFGGRDVLATAEGYLADGLMDCACKLYDRSNGAEITGLYRDRYTREMAVITTVGVVYRDIVTEA